MSTVAVVPYLVHYDTLLQNGTGIITKCDSFITTTRQKDDCIRNSKSSDLLKISHVVREKLLAFFPERD